MFPRPQAEVRAGGEPIPCFIRWMEGQRKGKFMTGPHSLTQEKFQLLQEASSDYT